VEHLANEEINVSPHPQLFLSISNCSAKYILQENVVEPPVNAITKLY
jgi:hypothetical protein